MRVKPRASDDPNGGPATVAGHGRGQSGGKVGRVHKPSPVAPVLEGARGDRTRVAWEAGPVEERTLDELRADRLTWDDHVATTEGIDHWCSMSPWMLGVHTAFSHAAATADVLVGVAEDGQLAFARRHLEDGSGALLPMDATWAFGSAIVSSAEDTRALERFCRDCAAWLIADPDWRLLACSGIAEGSPLDRALIAAFAPHARVLAGPDTDRCVAALGGGLEAWQARRTRTFRRNIRQAERRAEDAGVTVEIADGLAPHVLVERLHGVEQASWKGVDGSGIESPEMGTLYAGLVLDLSSGPNTRGSLRCAFARLGGRDVGFVLGGVLGDTYRGLQLSFVENIRTLSIGNVLQAHEVARLCADGVGRYDLGMDIPYKRNWGEQLVTTRTLLVAR